MALNDVKPMAPYKAKDVGGKLPEYDAMRSRLGQRVNADTQQQQDAMARRFAAQGGLNSGAAIKQQQLVAESGAQNREQAMEGINQQESAERRRLAEVEAQKEFQSQEAAVGRQFQAQESQLGRQFQSKESLLGREHQRGMFDDDMKFKTKVQAWSESQAAKQMELAWAEMNFNKQVALSGMDDDELLGMGADGDAYRERKAAKKGEQENAKNRDRYQRWLDSQPDFVRNR